MGLLKTRMIGSDPQLEHCWVLVGDLDHKLWWGRMRRMTRGAPCSVSFDAPYALAREEAHGDVVGFLHTHPGMIAIPSDRDYRTMRAWVSCFGKSLVCVIEGTDGLRGYWFDDDESAPIECQVKSFGSLLVGTTECDDLIEVEDGDGEQSIPSRGDLPGQGPGEEAPAAPSARVWGGGPGE